VRTKRQQLGIQTNGRHLDIELDEHYQMIGD